jgi:hypothetical protein
MAGTAGCGTGVEQALVSKAAASRPSVAARGRHLESADETAAHEVATSVANEAELRMWLIVAEALLALGLLVFIIWWTMFHGRGKPPKQD